MFRSARLKLTALYLVIIMTISIIFSIGMYGFASSEVDRAVRRDQFEFLRQHNIMPPPGVIIQPNPQVVQDATDAIKFRLFVVNIIIMCLSGGLGYILSGRTLRPIANMVDEQHRFVSDASHELRTPLTTLKTSIEVTLRDKHLTMDAAKQALISNLEEVNSLQALTDNLLHLTQYEKTIPGSFAVIPVEKVITDAWTKVHALAKAKDISLAREKEKLHIVGDSISLISLFTILFDNAIKYSPEQTTITVTEQKHDGWVTISVADQGIGIHKNDVKKIFNRFYRSDLSRSKQFTPGYGLGLSIAKKIVDYHRGSILVTSILGSGTTFSVKLPFGAVT